MEKVIEVSIKQLLVNEKCPEEWKDYDLYEIYDEEVSFYVGQSYIAFNRIIEHIRNGYKARSDVGRFILCNWPKSMNYRVRMLSSKSEEFTDVGNDVLKAEEKLINTRKPCFNNVQNEQPTKLPERYLSPSSIIRCSRKFTIIVKQAESSIILDKKLKWIEM